QSLTRARPYWNSVAAKFAVWNRHAVAASAIGISAFCRLRRQGSFMLKAFKKADRGPFRRLSDTEILLFVSRTLQSRGGEPNAADIFGKLQNPKAMIDQQVIDLLDWTDSPGTDRFYASLQLAKNLLQQ